MSEHPDARARVRASDAEREAVVGRLNTACGEGRLTLEEFSDRVEQAYAAQWRDAFDPLVADLPGEETEPVTGGVVPRAQDAAPIPVARSTRRTRQWHITPIGGIRRTGRWRVAARMVMVKLIGGADLDLSEAELAAPEVELIHVALIGGVDIRVPAGVNVEVSGLTVLGGVDQRASRHTAPGAPTIRLQVYSLIGGVTVRG